MPSTDFVPASKDDRFESDVFVVPSSKLTGATIARLHFDVGDDAEYGENVPRWAFGIDVHASRNGTDWEFYSAATFDNAEPPTDRVTNQPKPNWHTWAIAIEPAIEGLSLKATVRFARAWSEVAHVFTGKGLPPKVGVRFLVER